MQRSTLSTVVDKLGEVATVVAFLTAALYFAKLGLHDHSLLLVGAAAGFAGSQRKPVAFPSSSSTTIQNQPSSVDH